MLRNKIVHYFAGLPGCYPLPLDDEQYKGWCVLDHDYYGVAINYSGPDVFECFANAELVKGYLREGDKEIPVLYLRSNIAETRQEFSIICEDFVSLGYKCNHREEIIKDPVAWWNKWKLLFGNNISEKMVYDILGELITYLKLLKAGKKPSWMAIDNNTHDLHTEECNYEVKTTLRKDVSKIHVNSQFQLNGEKPVYLIFYRMEEAANGISINDILQKILPFGVEMDKIEKYLSRQGLKKGNHYRNEKYTILEGRKYPIDEDFPRIVADSFKDKKFPKHIVHIEYIVDLDGLDYEIWL